MKVKILRPCAFTERYSFLVGEIIDVSSRMAKEMERTGEGEITRDRVTAEMEGGGKKNPGQKKRTRRKAVEVYDNKAIVKEMEETKKKKEDLPKQNKVKDSESDSQ